MSKNEDFGWERRETILRSLKNESRYLSHAILAFWKQRIDPWLYKDRSLDIKYRSLVLQGSILEFKVNISSYVFGLALHTPISELKYAKNNVKNDYACCFYEVLGLNIDES